LLTGSPGTAKTTLSGKVAETACRRGERVLYICFDESGEEIERNLESVGIRLGGHRRSGRLAIVGLASRARSGESQHAEILRRIETLRPRVLVVDPLSALLKQGLDTVAMDIAYRLVQDCKVRGITLFATALAGKSAPEVESSELHVSTLADTWMHLSYLVRSGERNRALTIVKSRGSGHSNQVRELVLGRGGITLSDVYVEEGEVLMGTLRFQREAAAWRKRAQDAESRALERARKQRAAADIAERIRAQQAELEGVSKELAQDERQGLRAEARMVEQRSRTSSLRQADRPATRKGPK
jgi:circadian clock protein KaiC